MSCNIDVILILLKHLLPTPAKDSPCLYK